jgi:hypothetical protein
MFHAKQARDLDFGFQFGIFMNDSMLTVAAKRVFREVGVSKIWWVG